MKKLFLTWALLVLVVLQGLAAISLDEFLNRKEVREVRTIQNESGFERILELMIEQPLDHHRPDGETFWQRVYISHVDPSRPVVMVTAGYDAKYYYTSEITAQLSCNQLMIEHRYFGESVPDSIQWEYLDTWQAASDHHRIVGMFRELYPGPWISTGISKGGQTVMYHSFYYPGDVDVRVPYVAPLNFGLEDKRIYSFLDQVGSAGERRKVMKFQKMALKRQEEYLEAFRSFSEDKGYSYELAGGVEKAYEYCVLEYSFAFWQWGYVPSGKIPGRQASPERVIEHMNRVAGFDYFSDQFIIENRPFFYQALTEMGYYGYDLEAFKKYLKHVDNPVFTFTIPENVELSFKKELSYKLQEYLSQEADDFIFIYGEYDTWSATAVTSTGQTNSRIFVKEGGSHRTRINNMPEEQRKKVYATLETFLD
ncbi:MAG: S28 family serine protease [Bacteroidales bacterium]|nr:S28 family serine protease [Bacteroidales bacterium]